MWTQPHETTGEFSRNLNSRAFQFAEHDIRKITTRRSSNERSKTLCGRLLMSFRKLLGDLGLEKKLISYNTQVSKAKYEVHLKHLKVSN